MGCGAFRDNNCKVGDKIETLCLSLGLFQTILRIHQEYASENGKKLWVMWNKIASARTRHMLVYDQFWFLENCPPTPPPFLTQHFALSEK